MNTDSTTQLPLRLAFPAPRRFDAYVVGDNELAFAAIQKMNDVGAESIFLHGPEGSGKSHLLRAAAATFQDAVYLPLCKLGDQAEVMMATVRPESLVCVDDIEAIVGKRDAEVALFDLYNRTRDSGGRLLVAARSAPSRVGMHLPDLVSRLSSLLQLSLKPLSEESSRLLLQSQAEQRGFELDEEVVDFLFRRFPRNLGAMLSLIEHLDHESLSQRRRITVPFVRGVVARVLAPDVPD